MLVDDSKVLTLDLVERTCWMLDRAVASDTAMGSEERGWPLTVWAGGAMALLLTIATTDPTEMITGPFAVVTGFQKRSVDDRRWNIEFDAIPKATARAHPRTALVSFHLRIRIAESDGSKTV